MRRTFKLPTSSMDIRPSPGSENGPTCAASTLAVPLRRTNNSPDFNSMPCLASSRTKAPTIARAAEAGRDNKRKLSLSSYLWRMTPPPAMVSYPRRFKSREGPNLTLSRRRWPPGPLPTWTPALLQRAANRRRSSSNCAPSAPAEPLTERLELKLQQGLEPELQLILVDPLERCQ